MRILKPSELKFWKMPPEQLTPEQLATAHELARAAFSADDLQRYTELDEGISAEAVLEELEALERKLDEKTE